MKVSQSQDLLYARRVPTGPAVRVALLAVSVIVLARNSCSAQESALTVAEYYGIVTQGSPFYTRPGPIAPADASNARIPDAVKWTIVRDKWISRWLKEHGAPSPRLESLSVDERVDYELLTDKAAPAFYAELTADEQIALARREASRPDSEIDRMISEAYKWAEYLNQLSKEERIHRRAALDKSDLRAEVRWRYNQRIH